EGLIHINSGAFPALQVYIDGNNKLCWYPGFGGGALTTTTTVPGTTVASGSNGVPVSTFAGAGVLNVAAITGFITTGQVVVAPSTGYAEITYTGISALTLTGCTTVTGTGTLATGGTVTDGNWHSILYSWDGASVARLIYDGTVIDSSTGGAAMPTSTSEWLIGAIGTSAAPSNSFYGKLDERSEE